MNLSEELIRKSGGEISSRRNYKADIMSRLDIKPCVPIWAKAGGFILLLLSAGELVHALILSNIDLLARLGLRKPSELLRLDVLGPLLAQTIPWLNLLAVGLLGLLLYSMRRITWTRLAPSALGVGMLALGGLLSGTSTLAYLDISKSSTADRERLAFEIKARSNVDLNNEESRDARPDSLANLPACEDSDAPICMYDFGPTNGGEVIALPKSYLTDKAKMQELGRTLNHQTNGDSDGVKILLYSARDAAGLVPEMLKTQQGLTVLSKEKQNYVQNHYVGEYVRNAPIPGVKLSQSKISWWTHPNEQPRVIEFEAGISEVDGGISPRTESGYSYLVGRVMEKTSSRLTLVNLKNPASPANIIDLRSTTLIRSSQDEILDLNSVKAGDIVYILAKTDNEEIEAVLIVDDAGFETPSGAIELDMMGIDVKRYEAVLKS